ncbi:hypothetical protein EYZ11_010497 [Aspergillus tanneri]|uniref:Uncharacterized protein n=1 Tax=Aspergillus tanneri TaxID=1220188 RepID=A0A4S3J573_9EURO|nr:hypothetical protein EYZ11_010497 [Aspergillus tanneri]
MDAQQIVQDVQPLVGQIVPIRTVQESRPREDFDNAYVAEVNVKSASKVIKALDSNFPRDSSQSTHHLRRFSKHTQLPETLRSILIQGEPSSQTIFVLISPPLPDIDSLQKLLSPFVPTPTEPENINLHTIRVPIQPPLNVSQAEKWSAKYWPVVYNPAAPRANIAPPPQILTRTRDSIQPKAGHYLALAYKVADEAEQSGLGRRVGAVVVDPELEARINKTTDNDDGGIHWADAVVAVAGDARYSRREVGTSSKGELQLGSGPNPARGTYNPDLEGGPELHALMRAVDLIASVRRGSTQGEKPRLSPLETHFLSQSETPHSGCLLDSRGLSPVPEKYQKTDTDAIPKSSSSLSGSGKGTPRIRSREQGGYLCTDLDVYMTHEPWGLASEPVISPVMEADATNEPSASNDDNNNSSPAEDPEDAQQAEESSTQPHREYYGLHWRKELNWRALGFEFIEEGGSQRAAEEVNFHA